MRRDSHSADRANGWQLVTNIKAGVWGETYPLEVEKNRRLSVTILGRQRVETYALEEEIREGDQSRTSKWESCERLTG